ncbi:sigma 54-interacting transcriptional regulator [Sorangium sp. So ce542]|uniref:sigma 54-interacting transcriptional regulator n=1 Tax=Sorangium sp. So ce542 TaxID=3133316 RepID=UPI003F5EE9CB
MLPAHEDPTAHPAHQPLDSAVGVLTASARLGTQRLVSGEPDRSTLSATGGQRTLDAPGKGAFLFLVVDSHRPLASPARIALDDVEEVVIGRGSSRRLEVTDSGPRRRVEIRLDDPWLSSRHARFMRVLGRWCFEDCGSKNGCVVNGSPRKQAELAEGDVIELGRTFFLYRTAMPRGPKEGTLLEASSLSVPVPGLLSLIPSQLEMFRQLALVAGSTIPVLLHGETGTGKEVMARAIHALSGRPGAFVPINCGALPRELVEGELFGHRRGAFSGAIEDSPGLVRSADRGTLFLDEIGDLHIAAQAALLRVLQEREVRPVGGTRAIAVDLRVVSATHRPLRRMAALGEFRNDLLARLAGHDVELSPLRDRREDLGLLLAAVLRRVQAERAEHIQLHPRATRALLTHSWPLNIRELEQCITTAAVLAQHGAIDLDHLNGALKRNAADAAAHGDDAARPDELKALLREHGGNIAGVARTLGKARMQIHRWLKRYQINPDDFRR